MDFLLLHKLYRNRTVLFVAGSDNRRPIFINIAFVLREYNVQGEECNIGSKKSDINTIVVGRLTKIRCIYRDHS